MMNIMVIMMVLAIRKVEACKTPWKDREIYYNRRVIVDLEQHVRELTAKVDKIHGEEDSDKQDDLQEDDAVVEEVLQEYYQDYSFSAKHDDLGQEAVYGDYYSDYLPEGSRKKRDLDLKVEEELFEDKEESVNYLGPEFEEYYEEYYPEKKKQKRSSDNILRGIYEAREQLLGGNP